MSDKGWLCIVCGHYIHEQSPNELALEGGMAHKYCLEAEKVGAADERERIIELLEGTDLLKTIESGAFVNYADTAIELIKGEQK